MKNPWAQAKRRKIRRPSSCGKDSPLVELDRGVNYFIESLERLGATTHNSCDGHGDATQFYISFTVPRYSVAEAIASVGYFNVELVRPKTFRLGLPPSVDIKKMPGGGYRAIPCKTIKGKEAELLQTLRWASEAWEEQLFNVKNESKTEVDEQ